AWRAWHDRWTAFARGAAECHPDLADDLAVTDEPRFLAFLLWLAIQPSEAEAWLRMSVARISRDLALPVAWFDDITTNGGPLGLLCGVLLGPQAAEDAHREWLRLRDERIRRFRLLASAA